MFEISKLHSCGTGGIKLNEQRNKKGVTSSINAEKDEQELKSAATVCLILHERLHGHSVDLSFYDEIGLGRAWIWRLCVFELDWGEAVLWGCAAGGLDHGQVQSRFQSHHSSALGVELMHWVDVVVSMTSNRSHWPRIASRDIILHRKVWMVRIRRGLKQL